MPCCFFFKKCLNCFVFPCAKANLPHLQPLRHVRMMKKLLKLWEVALSRACQQIPCTFFLLFSRIPGKCYPNNPICENRLSRLLATRAQMFQIGLFITVALIPFCIPNWDVVTMLTRCGVTPHRSECA
jgi:hypothetical protein